MRIFVVMLGIILLLLSFPLTYVHGQEQRLSLANEDKSGYKAVVPNLKELIDTTPSLKAQIDKSLTMQDEKSYWHNKTRDDFIKFFEEWIVYRSLSPIFDQF